MLDEKELTPAQFAAIKLREQLVEEIIELIDLDEATLESIKNDLKDSRIENLEMYDKLIQILNIDDPVERYSLTNPEGTRRSIVSDIREYFLTPQEISLRNGYVDSDLGLVQEMLEDKEFRDEKGRDYQKMLGILDPDGRRGLTMLGLKEYIRAQKKQAKLNEFLHIFNDYDRDLILEMVKDPEYIKPNTSRDYRKMLTILDPNGSRGLTVGSIRSLIDRERNKGRIKTRESAGSYSNFNQQDLDILRKVLNDPEYRILGNARNMEKILNLLNPNGARKINLKTLENFITDSKAKGELVETITYSRSLKAIESPKPNTPANHKALIQQMLNDADFFKSGGGRNYEKMVTHIEEVTGEIIKVKSLESYIRKRLFEGELTTSFKYDPSDHLNVSEN